MATDMGKGIMAPDGSDVISSSGVQEMRTLAAGAAKAVQEVESDLGGTLDGLVSGGVTKITASPNPYLATTSGELLLVTDTPKYFTTFHDTPEGEAPVGLVDRWGTNYTREVVPNETALGGKVLRLSATTQGARLLSIPEPDALEDPSAGEIVLRWRATNAESVPRLLFWGSGEAGSEYGIHSIYRAVGNVSSGWFINHSSGTAEGVPWTFTPNKWYISRVRVAFSRQVEGPQFNAKMFAADNPERDSWVYRTAERLDQLPQQGWMGIYFRGPGDAEIDWLGASWDTGAAPKPEVR